MKTKGLLKSFKLYFLFFILFYSMVFIYGIYLFVCVCVDVASVQRAIQPECMVLSAEDYTW
jgi:hypothetical protein